MDPRIVDTTRLSYVAFDPAWLRVLRTSDGRRRTAQEALDAVPGALIALDGPMYRETGTGRGDPQYALLDRTAGLDEPSERSASGISLGIVDGRWAVRPGGVLPTGSKTGVQLYPTLVLDGQVQSTAAHDQGREWRAGVAALRDGRILFATGQMAMADFARELLALGAVHAGYTDGGGSARLVARDGTWRGSRENRAVPSWLLAVPTSSGPSRQLIVGCSLLTVGYLLWRTRHSELYLP